MIYKIVKSPCCGVYGWRKGFWIGLRVHGTMCEMLVLMYWCCILLFFSMLFATNKVFIQLIRWMSIDVYLRMGMCQIMMKYLQRRNADVAQKRVAESLEKLMDATREELPDTKVVVQLSGMEISDLTMELSNNGSDSELFWFKSRELVEVTTSSKDLRHSVLAVLEVDQSGGPRIQNAAMELYRRKEESAKINITSC